MSNLTRTESASDFKMWAIFLTRIEENDPAWVPVTLITILIVIFCVGFTGNVLTCVVIYYVKTLHTTTNFFLFNMAISDAFACFGIVIKIFVYFSDGLLYGDIACKMHYAFILFLWNNSILVMIILSIERYVAICCPLRLKNVPSLKQSIAVIWLIAILETALEIPTVSLIKCKTLLICYTVPTEYARIINGILALVSFVIPLAILLFVYSMIAFKVNVSDKVNLERNISNYRSNSGRMYKLLVAMTVSFVICWLPFCTLRILIFANNIQQLMQLETNKILTVYTNRVEINYDNMASPSTFALLVWATGYRLVLINSWLSSILNPILFSLMSSKFRKALKVIWITKIKGQRLPEVIAV